MSLVFPIGYDNAYMRVNKADGMMYMFNQQLNGLIHCNNQHLKLTDPASATNTSHTSLTPCPPLSPPQRTPR